MASGLRADKELSHGISSVTKPKLTSTEIDRLRLSGDSSNGERRREDITNTMSAATKGAISTTKRPS